MCRRILAFIILIFATSLFAAQDYTVVFKNGRTMKGELISETDETIVFKDSDGVQFSLKKSNLDLDKMKEANAAPPPIPPPPAPAEEKAAPTAPKAPAPKKEARVYTAQDLEKLREKYGELATSRESELADAVLAGEVTPQNYYQYLKEGGSRVESVFQEIGSLIDGMTTAWEVNASTGKDPLAAFRNYRSGKAATDIMQSISSELSSLETVRDGLSNPPENYRAGFEAFSGAVQTLNDYFEEVRQYDGNPPINVFRSRIAETESSIKARIAQIKNISPAPEPVRPQQEEESQETQSQLM